MTTVNGADLSQDSYLIGTELPDQKPGVACAEAEEGRLTEVEQEEDMGAQDSIDSESRPERPDRNPDLPTTDIVRDTAAENMKAAVLRPEEQPLFKADGMVVFNPAPWGDASQKKNADGASGPEAKTEESKPVIKVFMESAKETVENLVAGGVQVVADLHGLGHVVRLARACVEAIKWLETSQGDRGIGAEVPLLSGSAIDLDLSIHIGSDEGPQVTLCCALSGDSPVDILEVDGVEIEPGDKLTEARPAEHDTAMASSQDANPGGTDDDFSTGLQIYATVISLQQPGVQVQVDDVLIEPSDKLWDAEPGAHDTAITAMDSPGPGDIGSGTDSRTDSATVSRSSLDPQYDNLSQMVARLDQSTKRKGQITKVRGNLPRANGVIVWRSTDNVAVALIYLDGSSYPSWLIVILAGGEVAQLRVYVAKLEYGRKES
jgi:hypothetical protein